MKDKSLLRRKCSAVLATGAGAVVCLASGGPAQAVFVSGNLKDSNGGTTSFGPGGSMKAFSSMVMWLLTKVNASHLRFSSLSGVGQLNATTLSAKYAAVHDPGVTVSTGMAGGFKDLCWVPLNVSNKYFAVRFDFSGNTYGWIHVVSTDGSGNSIVVDKWGAENDHSPCKTLADSVTTRRLCLSDGRVKLHWANANEEGVARYEVQAQDASGAWNAIDSSAPGEGSYAATTSGDATCRLLVERVDGTSEEMTF